MLCGGWTPVLRVLECASWIMRTSSSTWLRPSSRSLMVALKAFSVSWDARMVIVFDVGKQARGCTVHAQAAGGGEIDQIFGVDCAVQMVVQISTLWQIAQKGDRKSVV